MSIDVDPDYSSRAGYDPAFLDRAVPLPRLANAVRAKAFRVPGISGHGAYELKYHHFSVILNQAARLAFMAAVNYDAAAAVRHTRAGSDRWFPDPRVDEASQAGNEFYTDNPLDRGHLVRRTDAGWGATAEEAKRANDDTFHFTNCTPQHEIFNQARRASKQDLLLWGNLEEHVASQAATAGHKISVFNGPVFRSTDRLHRGLAVPQEFWKVIVYARAGASPSLGAVAFILSQEGLIAHLPLEEFAVGPYRPYQVKLREIEARTKLDFGDLRRADPLEDERHEAVFESRTDAVALASLGDVIL
jgi:endonuclease G